ncbi:MAG: hypothetical protein ABII22_00430 [Candidatus Micrarchaeota archaeon]
MAQQVQQTKQRLPAETRGSGNGRPPAVALGAASRTWSAQEPMRRLLFETHGSNGECRF